MESIVEDEEIVEASSAVPFRPSKEDHMYTYPSTDITLAAFPRGISQSLPVRFCLPAAWII